RHLSWSVPPPFTRVWEQRDPRAPGAGPMSRAFRVTALLTGLVLLAGGPGQGQEKKGQKKAPAKFTPAVEPTDTTPKVWVMVEVKVGVKMLSDRDYLVSQVPKELAGGTFLMRSSGEIGRWFPDATLKARKDGTAYAAVRIKYLAGDTFGEAARKQFMKD